jgi:hypothetical protein
MKVERNWADCMGWAIGERRK